MSKNDELVTPKKWRGWGLNYSSIYDELGVGAGWLVVVVVVALETVFAPYEETK